MHKIGGGGSDERKHDMAMAKYDCQECGACCGHMGPHSTQVELDDADLDRLPFAVRQHVVTEWPEGGQRKQYLPTQKGMLRGIPNTNICVALDHFGMTGGRYFHKCTVYKDRPRRCDEFEVGAQRCQIARVAYGLATPEEALALHREFAAAKKGG